MSASVVCQSERPGNSTGAGPSVPAFWAPQADSSPAGWSRNNTAASGATAIEAGCVITASEPCAMPVHELGPVQLTPAGMTTTFASVLDGFSGWANTAPPGGGAGVGEVRRQT